MLGISSRRKPENVKKTSFNKISEQSLIQLSKKSTEKQRRDVVASEEREELIEVFKPSVINILS